MRRAVGEMRTIATAVEAFAVDWELYPPAGTGLWKRLVPTYLRRFPMKDPWGNAYRYETGPKRDHYVLASSGEEEFSRLPESYFREVAATGLESSATGRLAGPSEIVYSDGTFLRLPFPEGGEGMAFLPDLHPCASPGGGAPEAAEPGVSEALCVAVAEARLPRGRTGGRGRWLPEALDVHQLGRVDVVDGVDDGAVVGRGRETEAGTLARAGGGASRSRPRSGGSGARRRGARR